MRKLIMATCLGLLRAAPYALAGFYASGMAVWLVGLAQMSCGSQRITWLGWILFGDLILLYWLMIVLLLVVQVELLQMILLRKLTVGSFFGLFVRPFRSARNALASARAGSFHPLLADGRARSAFVLVLAVEIALYGRVFWLIFVQQSASILLALR